jgi:hypothetical protein
MNYIQKYNEWDNISEATLDDSKELVDYDLSRSGRVKMNKLEVSENIKLTTTNLLPGDNEFVIQIRPSSFRLIEFSKFIELYKIEDMSKIFIYETTSTKYPYAVALKGIKTTMLKQSNRKGASARGNYFRETAFLITLAIRLWETKGVKIDIYSNRGKIDISFSDGFAMMSKKERGEFRNQYDFFMTNKKLVDSFIKQIDELINHLGDSIYNIKSVIKNSSNLLINKMASEFLKKEVDTNSSIANQSQNISDFNKFEIPGGVTLSKWNPSDFWILYKNNDWVFNNKKSYKYKNINELEELNVYLHNCISNKEGIIGVSLKQQIDNDNEGKNTRKRLYEINLDEDRKFSHDYKGYYVKNTIKSSKIKFSYEKLGGILGFGEIDVRTFDTDKNTPISMEVKGSIKSQHMSGKAGSYIKFVMPNDKYKVLEFIRKNNVEEIKSFIESNYKFIKLDLKEIFYNDLESPKTGQSNSRMQAIIFTDWLESLPDDKKNELVSGIIKYAKSESNWSAPHLLLK